MKLRATNKGNGRKRREYLGRRFVRPCNGKQLLKRLELFGIIRGAREAMSNAVTSDFNIKSLLVACEVGIIKGFGPVLCPKRMQKMRENNKKENK